MKNVKNNIIKVYIRDENRKPRGVALAFERDGAVTYGYSLLHVKKDVFSKKLGERIALSRATSEGYELPANPKLEKLVIDAFAKLQARALKYFKGLPAQDVVVNNLMVKEYPELMPKPCLEGV